MSKQFLQMTPSVHHLFISKEEINHLRSNHMLTTNFLDYLTQNAVPKDIPDHVLIGSSNSYRFFEIQNERMSIHQMKSMPGLLDYSDESISLIT